MAHDIEIAGKRVELVRGDIVLERTEAIVNAANGRLLGGGGVDGAIHRAAGPELLQACLGVKTELPGGRLETGGAVITPGFRLPARFVVHCVGPVYSQNNGKVAELLASCYRKALELCLDRRLRSVAFPSISTGAYRYPVDEAAPIALRTVGDHLGRHQFPTLVRFTLFDDRTVQAYQLAAEKLFGAAPE